MSQKKSWLMALAALGVVLGSLSSRAYSAAENAAVHQKDQYLGCLAFAAKGEIDALKAVSAPNGAEKRLGRLGIHGFQIYSSEVDGQTLLFRRSVIEADADPMKVWSKALNDKTLAPWFEAQHKHIEAHPRAKDGKKWLRMEQVFFHAGPPKAPGKEARPCVSITGLKPEMEMQYRTLHQTTWPGVLQTIDNANIRNYCIYLVEIGDKLYLLSHFDYVGDDFKADMDGIGKDPTTRRWWKHTDPCQLPLPGAAGIWRDMDPVYPPAK